MFVCLFFNENSDQLLEKVKSLFLFILGNLLLIWFLPNTMDLSASVLTVMSHCRRRRGGRPVGKRNQAAERKQGLGRFYLHDDQRGR